MYLDIDKLGVRNSYKLLTNLVVPRPIALVTSADAHGHLNAAPFSFFNLIGADPPLVVLGVGNDASGLPKHTARNIAETRQFVVNLVTEELSAAMNICAIDFPDRFSELAAAGLHTAASVRISVPRIAEARVSLECELVQSQRIGQNNVIIGQVLALHTADGVVDERHNVHDFAPIGRMGAPSWYCRSTDHFEIHRMTFAQWQAQQQANTNP